MGIGIRLGMQCVCGYCERVGDSAMGGRGPIVVADQYDTFHFVLQPERERLVEWRNEVRALAD